MQILNQEIAHQPVPLDALRGLQFARVVTFLAGERLVRFADASRPATTWALGDWWIYERDYQRIAAEHRRVHSLAKERCPGESGIAHVATAVMPGWNRMDAMVRAVVIRPFHAFVGWGRYQETDVPEARACLVLVGWCDLKQIFIPNIKQIVADNGRETPALQVLCHTFLAIEPGEQAFLAVRPGLVQAGKKGVASMVRTQ